MKLAHSLLILPVLALLSLSSCTCCNNFRNSLSTMGGIERARTFYTYDDYAPRHHCDYSYIWPTPPNNTNENYWCDTYGKLNLKTR